MDATKLIEEAGREIAHMKAEALSAANPYNENTIRLTLLIDLAAALKASEERARKAEDLAAANLAANKRIVELEHDLDAARTELARLTTPRPIAEAPLWMPVNRDSAYGEPPRDVLDRHLRNGGLWLVEDSAAHAHRAIFRTWKHPTEDRICWADARGEGLFLGRIRPLLFAPLDIDCNRLPLPVLP